MVMVVISGALILVIVKGDSCMPLTHKATRVPQVFISRGWMAGLPDTYLP